MGDEPLLIRVCVYNLLPPSRLTSFLNVLGTGVYHSSVSLSLPLGPSDRSSPSPKEYAFGGHYTPGTTGIFSVPEGTASQRMPGLRYYLTHEMGEAFGGEWEKVFGPKKRGNNNAGGVGAGTGLMSRVSSRGSSVGGGSVDDKPQTRSPTPIYAQFSGAGESTIDLSPTTDPFSDPPPSSSSSLTSDEDWIYTDDGGISDGTEYLSTAQRRAWRIIEAMRKEPEWEGTKYSLLNRNCNTFTDELVWRLTGRRAPSYLNRAAWFATSAPCLIPAGWIDDEDEPDETTASSHNNNNNNNNVVVVPPRADQMSVAGR